MMTVTYLNDLHLNNKLCYIIKPAQAYDSILNALLE